jgi:UDP-glucose 4-epimerase
MKSILLTGGLGFIGSHIAVELYRLGYRVTIIDNLANSHIKTLQTIDRIIGKLPKFYNIDMTQPFDIPEEIDIVIHLAGLKSVSESIEDSLKYYQVNLVSTFNLVNFMKQKGIKKLVFSSSATVYGNSESPLSLKSSIGNGITNPYGKTKYFIEEILRDYSISNTDMEIISLRYFNPIGCLSGLQENPKNRPNNIVPVILKALRENGELKIFGNDYPTPDGTAIRDYIHVIDLANCHCQAFNKFEKGFQVFNVGTGKGTSVMELVKLFEKNGMKVNYSIAPRRSGDLAEVYCIPDDSFIIKRSVEDAVRDIINNF